MLVVKSIPAFNDNYIWLIHNNQGECAVVDPGDHQPVINYLQQHELTLSTILITHHHADHVGGVAALKRAYKDAKVVGPTKDAVAGLSQSVQQGDSFELFGETFEVLDLPGHTLGHIGYLADEKLFCGDVLFSAGCGRVFEGTPEQMWSSLSKLASLDSKTQVFCAHEYTASNLAFALAVEPGNSELQKYRDKVNQLRGQQRPTLPSTIGLESAINPFLRVTQPEIMDSVRNKTEDLSPLGVFTALRKWKDHF
ncbi:hydroxyacylglutathione hydrolase [Vibrio ishigakensis]|uniref:Hydroxyacylglutathione hydrolase n=1 Tax=Vibrio ishigakensis TaxID=1481914 RepID=A0A0B8NYF3_9VIBR|nr:hydroxyacylglutathione hydrolase [Vibrio ishigakensis]GAM57342.1 hydroxyacylglutathione hydrolase [Vibrio ishigakensis]